jgi:hypothetical protein
MHHNTVAMRHAIIRQPITWILMVCLLVCSCSKAYNSLGQDPKNPAVVPSATLFLQAEKDFFDACTSAGKSIAPFRVLAQEWTENTYVYEAVYDFSPYQAPDGWWNDLYVNVLHNLEAARQRFPADISDPVQVRHSEDITDILEVYAYYMIMTTYGDLPYTESEKETIPFPRYDNARQVYEDLFVRLDSSISGLAIAGASIPSGAEQVYGGDPRAWIKFAATLKLKMALLSADADPTGAESKVLEAVSTGVFTANSDNALLAYDPSSPGNSNPVWQELAGSGQHNFCPANLLVNTMLAWEDPRLPFYFSLDGYGGYSGGVPGAGNGYGAVSDFSRLLQQPAFPADILDYPEAEFLLAEAAARGFPVGGTAESHYDDAITGSIEYWSLAGGRTSGSADSTAALYLSRPQVAYAAAAGPWQRKIGYQQWIAAYGLNWDAWTIIRRLGYPDLDSVNPPVGAHGNLPLRFTYPTVEQAANPVNWKAAATALPGGQDVVSAKLWWMRP